MRAISYACPLQVPNPYIHQLHRYQRRSYNNSCGLLNIFPKESYQTSGRIECMGNEIGDCELTSKLLKGLFFLVPSKVNIVPPSSNKLLEIDNALLSQN